MRKIAIQFEPSRIILVVLSVAVVIDAFGVEGIDAFLSFFWIGQAHESRFLRVWDPLALEVSDPHLGDQAVFVQVLGPILIQKPVVIVVKRTGVRAFFVADGSEEILGGIRVEQGSDIDRTFV